MKSAILYILYLLSYVNNPSTYEVYTILFIVVKYFLELYKVKYEGVPILDRYSTPKVISKRGRMAMQLINKSCCGRCCPNHLSHLRTRGCPSLDSLAAPSWSAHLCHCSCRYANPCTSLVCSFSTMF